MMSRMIAVFVLCLGLVNPSLAEDYKEISWDDLMPIGWEPKMPEIADAFEEELEGGFGFTMQDLDAPVVADLDKRKLKIPGYILPIKFDATSLTEFLLVPYIGACIHVPPPPQNQIVYVVLDEPLKGADFWEPVWVSGVMSTEQETTEYATAGYRLSAAVTEKYEY